jgi:hypothetical protein
MSTNWVTATLVAVSLMVAPSLLVAQNPPPQRAPEPGGQPEAASPPPAYKPPLRGAPGGRVGGASRGTVKPVTPLATIDLLAPDGHSGLTASATPTLYFYVSRRVNYPTRLTISAPRQPLPIIEANIPSPLAAGIYAVRLGDYRVRLEPGLVYTWSVSIILNPDTPSRDVVASASLLRVPPDLNFEAAVRAAPAPRRAALFADAGLWYDAVAAAADLDQHAALAELLSEVGLDRLVGASVRSGEVVK